jgi:signal transduction histidine kinase
MIRPKMIRPKMIRPKMSGGNLLAERVNKAPIARKLLVIAMLTSAVALLLAGAGIVFADSLLFRGYLQRDLAALARIAADNSTAALSFDDPKAASDVLHTLRARPHLQAACTYRPNGTVFATYIRYGASDPCLAVKGRNSVSFRAGEVIVSVPVAVQDRVVGSLTLLYDLGEIAERMRLYGGTVLLVLLASSVVAFLLSSRLRSIIVTPLAQLVEATTVVSETGDYGVRVRRISGDELGTLTDAFDEMLSRIQVRDRESRAARDELARLNADLEQSNEKLAQSNEDLERFAFVASHDLQEPLRMITLFSQLLVRTYSGPVSEEGGGYVRNIVAAAKRMRELLTDLLAYTDIGAPAAGAAKLVDLNRTLEHVLENLKAAIDESHATVTSEPLPVLRVHEGHFISLFQNLISNALKYRSSAPPEVHVRCSHVNGVLRFAVKDNGIGIDPEYHARIFMAFKRLHGQTIAGTGIGLAICQRVVDRYHGRIRVESEAGAGAEFIFTLPEDLLVQS